MGLVVRGSSSDFDVSINVDEKYADCKTAGIIECIKARFSDSILYDKVIGTSKLNMILQFKGDEHEVDISFNNHSGMEGIESMRDLLKSHPSMKTLVMLVKNHFKSFKPMPILKKLESGLVIIIEDKPLSTITICVMASFLLTQYPEIPEQDLLSAFCEFYCNFPYQSFKICFDHGHRFVYLPIDETEYTSRSHFHPAEMIYIKNPMSNFLFKASFVDLAHLNNWHRILEHLMKGLSE